MTNHEKKTARMTVEDAEAVAVRAHAGQTDKAGVPYIEHPRAVAARLSEQGWGEDVIIAGWLHDVVEDTDVSLADLTGMGASSNVVRIVDAVTRRAGETYMDMIRGRICPVPGAVAVKLADNWHNSQEFRLVHLPVEQAEFLRGRYGKARGVLVGAMVAHLTGVRAEDLT